MSDRSMGILACLVLAIIVIGGPIYLYEKNQTETVQITVIGKESVANSGGHSQRVYAEDDTYTVGDAMFHGRFDSSRLYGRLKVGETYRCKAMGWRVPFLSAFKNLLECEAVVR